MNRSLTPEDMERRLLHHFRAHDGSDAARPTRASGRRGAQCVEHYGPTTGALAAQLLAVELRGP